MIRSKVLRFSLIAALMTFVSAVGGGFGLLNVAVAQQNPAPASGGNLQERVSQLEQRIADLQAVIATLQSFVKQGGAAQAPAGALPSGGAAGPGGGPSELSIRVLALETQIRALTGQMEQANSRFGGAPGGTPGTGAPLPPVASPSQPGADFGAPPAPAQQATPYGAAPPAPTQQVAPSPQARPPWQADPNAVAPSPIPTPPPQSGQLPTPRLGTPGGGAQLGSGAQLGAGAQAGTGAQAAYDASYQNFLRNDLRAAEQGFRSFVATYPNDRLASNAYYWLGRTHFAAQQFEPAAKAFLAGYKKNKKGAVAPDSLLHLGKSLAAMGEKDAACSTLKAVAKQFPAAPGQLRQDVSAEMKRTGC